MGRRIVIPAGRPEFWLGLLFVWTLLSALRSWHTPWARVAGTEALRWGAGLALALALGRGLPRLRLAAQSLDRAARRPGADHPGRRGGADRHGHGAVP